MKGYTLLMIFFLLHYEASCIGYYSESRTKEPSITEEHLNWDAFHGNSNTGVKNSGLKENNKQEQKPFASTIYRQQDSQQHLNNENNAALSWDGEHCPPKTTGLFPIQSDCQKFLNCFKGRGYVQPCAPGTLFNPNSLECDYPAKVQCLDGNPSKIDTSYLNRNPSQNFDLNTQSSNRDRVFNINTNQPQPSTQYQPQPSTQYQPQPSTQYQPQPSTQYQPQPSMQYQPQPSTQYQPQPSTQYQPQPSTQYQPHSNNQYQPQTNNNTNDPGSIQQQFPNRQHFNQNSPTKPVLVNSNTNYPGSIQQQAPSTNVKEYVNPGQENIPVLSSQSNFESPHFFPDQNNYEAPIDHDNVLGTQDTYFTRPGQNNQQKNKIRFPFVKETPSNFPSYNGNQKPVSSSSPNINPHSWMKEQLRGKQGTANNGNIHEQPEYEEYPPPNNYYNKPASTFDVSNGQQIEYNKQAHILNSQDGSQIHSGYGQQSLIPNGHGYNSNPSPSYSNPSPSYLNPSPSYSNPSPSFSNPSPSYLDTSKFDQHAQQNSYPTPQDRQNYGDSKMNKQFQIVVPELTGLTNYREPSPEPTVYPSNLNFNRGSPNRKSSTTDYQQQTIKNENSASIQSPNYDSQFPSQEHPVNSPSTTSLKCPNGFNGIKPHPSDCSKFLSCANGRTFEMDCGPGTLFNPTISVCDYPFNVECNRIVLSTTTSTTTEPYFPAIDVRLQSNRDTNSSDLVTKTEPLESQNQAVLETLPTENRQLKVLRNPTSIDLPDNFLPNSSIVHTPTKIVINKLENNIPVKIDLKPNSTQSIRLRGGPRNSEGFLQVQEKPFQWGVVCDEPNSWTIDKADIVCKQLGFKRGAEQTWQGLTVATDNPNRLLRNIGVTKVSCNGQESVFHNCKLQNDKVCHVERDAVWVKCRANSGSECQPEEVSYDGKCYKLFVPTIEKSKTIQDLGYSKAEALEHCFKRGGELLNINSQKENDFISEWLSRQKTEGPVLTSGVGISISKTPIWIWEGTNNPFVYQNWWPGWEFKKTFSPHIATNRALCIVLQKSYPCPSNPNSTKLCDSEYYHWEAIDCGTKTDQLPYICERKVDDIGCINGVGSDYIGSANTTGSGNACLSWEDQNVLIAMKYRVSEKTRRSLLNKHNKCRNPDGTDLQAWCYVKSSGGIVRSEFCDIPICNTELLRASPLIEEQKCDAGFFECQPYECITQAWVCDNQADCSNGMDEKNCSNVLDNFIKTHETRLTNREAEKWLHTSVTTCANRCMQADGFVCQSFSHNEIEQICVLNERTMHDNSTILESDKDWNYYEIDNALCNGKFICENGNCIDKSKECDWHNDCGDRSDEIKCTSAMMGYEIRLAGGNTSNEGRVEVKVLGEWGVICDDNFGLEEANVICQELGFIGPIAVKTNSHYGVPNKTRFVLDDLACDGNETSLFSCPFKDWEVHDCNLQESAGVVCKVAGGRACSNEEYECKSGECIPARFLCDSYVDCTDGSDESPATCNMPLEIRLVGGNKHRTGMEGRVEVRQFGVWGTVCDDSFGINEALVVCNSLGFKGTAEFKKEAAFGPGKGQIWLDQVRCVGNETSLNYCLHAKWGYHNCKHEEDVSVVCHLDLKKTNETQSTPGKTVTAKKKYLKDDLPNQCGKRLVAKSTSMVQQRIASGFNTERGDHPWQASIRSKTPAGHTEHVCGAVIISKYHILTAAHCVRDLDKDVYYVRIGDFNKDIVEDSEKDIDIDEIYNHENFEKTIKLNNDISVIKLKTNGIKFNQYVQPICLPSNNLKLKPNVNCTITGWGSDGSIGSSFAKNLRSASVPIIDMKICKAQYMYGKITISDGMFCAGNLDGGADACQGDSGGPLVCSTDLGETLIGITSWGYGCGRKHHPGVYTNVLYYEEWVNKTLTNSVSYSNTKNTSRLTQN